MTGTWHKVGTVGDVEEDEPLGASVDGTEIGVFLVGGTYYAIENICPHAFAMLSDGFVEGDQVECPLHQAVFQISTGKCLKEPAEQDVATYPVKVEGDDILVQV